MFHLDADWTRSAGSVPFGRPRGSLSRVLEDRSRFEEIGEHLVGRVAPGDLAELAPAWTALWGRVDGADVSALPDYVLPAMTHLARAALPSIIVVWRQASGIAQARLVGLAAVLRVTRLFAAPSVRFWTPPLAQAPVLLLDRDEAQGAAAAMLTWMARGTPVLLGLDLSLAPHEAARSGPLVAAARGLRLSVDMREASAAPRQAPANDAAEPPANGRLRVTLAKSHQEVAAAVEDFIALDIAAGRGSIVADEPTANFIRVVARGLANRDACRVASVVANEETVAHALVIGARGRRQLWAVAAVPGWRERAEGLIVARLRVAQAPPSRADAATSATIWLGPPDEAGRGWRGSPIPRRSEPREESRRRQAPVQPATPGAPDRSSAGR